MSKLYRRGAVWYGWVGSKRYSTGCTDKKAAAKRLGEFEREAVDPDHSAQAKAATVDLLDDLIRSLTRKGRAADTISFTTKKAGHLRRLLPALARDITHKVLERYIDTRRTEGACNSTVKKELVVLNATLKLARRNGLFARDVAEVMPELEANYKPRTRFVTPWEMVALCLQLEAQDAASRLSGMGPTDRAARVAFIVATGARWGESARARREDVAGGYVFLRGTKTATAKRTIPVVWVYADILAWGMDRAGEEKLFRPWVNVRHDLRRACTRAGIAPVSPNDLRRSHATWLRQAGVQPHLIGAQLGHTTSRMVELVYGRLPSADLGRLLREGTAPRGELLVSCERVQDGDLEATVRNRNVPDPAVIAVRRDGIEPPTRGFSIPCSTD
jgi:integrase